MNASVWPMWHRWSTVQTSSLLPTGSSDNSDKSMHFYITCLLLIYQIFNSSSDWIWYRILYGKLDCPQQNLSAFFLTTGNSEPILSYTVANLIYISQIQWWGGILHFPLIQCFHNYLQIAIVSMKAQRLRVPLEKFHLKNDKETFFFLIVWHFRILNESMCFVKYKEEIRMSHKANISIIEYLSYIVPFQLIVQKTLRNIISLVVPSGIKWKKLHK